MRDGLLAASHRSRLGLVSSQLPMGRQLMSRNAVQRILTEGSSCCAWLCRFIVNNKQPEWSMAVQVIVKSDTFIHAVQKMQRAMYEFQIRGVKTNIGFLEKVLRHEEFLSGAATTSFIDRRAPVIRS